MLVLDLVQSMPEVFSRRLHCDELAEESRRMAFRALLSLFRSAHDALPSLYRLRLRNTGSLSTGLRYSEPSNACRAFHQTNGLMYVSLSFLRAYCNFPLVQ